MIRLKMFGGSCKPQAGTSATRLTLRILAEDAHVVIPGRGSARREARRAYILGRLLRRGQIEGDTVDPVPAWDALLGALVDGEPDLAADAAENLATWIGNGGYVPLTLERLTKGR